MPLSEPPQLFCDNATVIYMSVNPMFHVHSKHIELDYHFVQETVTMGTLVTHHVFTHFQLADIFIKFLLKDVFTMFLDKLDVYIHSYSSLRRHAKGNIQVDTQNQMHKG